MVNKTARRLTDPFVIGAYGSRFSACMLNGFPDLTLAQPSMARNVLQRIRMYGTRGSNVRDADVPYIEKLITPARLRSHYRFARGKYKALPYEQLGLRYDVGHFNDHFVHIDPEDKTRIRYFQSEEHLEQDRHTTTSLGRYLTAYYADVYDANTIRDIASAFTAGAKRVDIRFLTTGEDITHAYMNGPASCMSKNTATYGLDNHPTYVYGDSDLALAIIKNGDRITARCLVWPDEKVFSRIYGDWRVMQEQLTRLGYSHGSLAGARIQLVDTDIRSYDAFLLPYIDAYNEASVTESNGCAAVYVKDNALYICERGDHERGLYEESYYASETSGYTRRRRREQCDCGHTEYSNNIARDAIGSTACSNCVHTSPRARVHTNGETTFILRQNIRPNAYRLGFNTDTNRLTLFNDTAVRDLVLNLATVFRVSPEFSLPTYRDIPAYGCRVTHILIDEQPYNIPSSMTRLFDATTIGGIEFPERHAHIDEPFLTVRAYSADALTCDMRIMSAQDEERLRAIPGMQAGVIPYSFTYIEPSNDNVQQTATEQAA